MVKKLPHPYCNNNVLFLQAGKIFIYISAGMRHCNSRHSPANDDARDTTETRHPKPPHYFPSSNRPFPQRYLRHARGAPQALMPPKDHECQCEDKNKYDVHRNQRQAPRCFCGRYFRRRHSQTRSDPKVVDDYSEELRELVAAVGTAWKYFLRDASLRLPPSWPNTA